MAIDLENEIIKTGQRERIIIYLIPSVPPKGEEGDFFKILIQTHK